MPKDLRNSSDYFEGIQDKLRYCSKECQDTYHKYEKEITFGPPPAEYFNLTPVFKKWIPNSSGVTKQGDRDPRTHEWEGRVI